MSDIQDLSQQVSKLMSDSDKLAADLYAVANGLRKTTDAVHQLMQSTSQRNYQGIISLLDTAQGKLANATTCLATASRSAETWLAAHAGGGMGPQSPIATESPGLSEIQDTAQNNPPLAALAEYMSAYNYGDGDYDTYSQDPVWRVLHRAAFPEDPLPPLAQAMAYALLMQFMSEHNYGKEDFETYSQDPIWQELHKYAFPDCSTIPDPSSSSQQYASIVDSLKQAGVSYQTIQPFSRERTTNEIIERLGGGDNTRGSCSSLAFAYAGNVAGYDVLDFRDGESRQFFSQNSSIEMVASLPGVDSTILSGRNDISCTNSLLNTMDEGKEYYLATGLHAAVVRKVDGYFEYLELQHPTDNGWHSLDDSVLLHRFRCSPVRLFECPNFLIDIDSLSENPEFLEILGYLNTAESEQHKGENGHVR